MIDKTNRKISNILHTVIIIVLLFMGIGYSAIKVSTDIDINGLIKIKGHTGIFITNVKYKDNTNADLTNSRINHYDDTFLDSFITLSDKDNMSKITYEITVYNSDNFSYYFNKVLYAEGEETYNNEQISFKLSNLEQGTEIKENSYYTFEITFYYKDNLLSSNNSLKSYLKFNFIRKTKLKELPNGTYSQELWKYRFSITKIIFNKEINTYDNAIAEFDVSADNDNSIVAIIILNDDNKTHTAYIESNEIISAPINSQYLFSGFTKLQSIENIEYLDTSFVENMKYMFSGDTNLESLDLSNFNTSKVENMEKMFRNNSKVENFNLENWDTSNVKDTSNMFENCNNLKTLDLSNWNTSNITNIQSMFEKSGIESINLNNWNMTKVEDFKNLFSECSLLKSIDLTSFNPTNAISIEGMFNNCTKLSQINLSNFDMTHISNTKNAFIGIPATSILIVKDKETKDLLYLREEPTLPESWTSNNITIAINN